MHKRKIAALFAAAFAGLMLSSPSFAQNTSGGPTSAQNTAPASGAPESLSMERADKQAAESKKAVDAAKADYKAAVEKCDAQPAGERSTCIKDAEAAQTLAMQKGLNGSPATSGAPESRILGPQSAK